MKTVYNPNEISRLSKIADHNIYNQTDHLYEPLRNALRKSTISPTGLLETTVYNNHSHDMRSSRISRNMRSLSPLQVQRMRSSVLIPVNRKLRPTHNFNKVMGKSFIAVDVQEKVFDPISQYDFSRIKRSPQIEEVVYETDYQQDKKNIYTTRNSNINISSRQIPKLLSSNSLNKSVLKEQLPTRQSLVYHKSPTTQITSPSQLNSSLIRQSKSYAFNHEETDGHSLNSKRRTKQEYKYNLFNILDEPANNGCKNGCCHANEIIASKPQRDEWK